MLEISNNVIAVACREDGTGLVLHDKRRGTRWTLDERTRLYFPLTEFDPHAFHISDDNPEPIGMGTARVTDGALEQQFVLMGERVTYRWSLLADGVDVE